MDEQPKKQNRALRYANAIGIMFVIGAVWWLIARSLGWDSANIQNAVVFAGIIYFGFKYTTD